MVKNRVRKNGIFLQRLKKIFEENPHAKVKIVAEEIGVNVTVLSAYLKKNGLGEYERKMKLVQKFLYEKDFICWMPDIMRGTGVSHGFLYNHIDPNALKQVREHMLKEKIREYLDLNGTSCPKTVNDSMGIRLHTVKRIMKEYFPSFIAKSPKQGKILEFIKKNKNMDAKFIADNLDLSKSTVQRFFKRNPHLKN